MLYISRKIGESVIINYEIEIMVTEIKGKNVKLGFKFPQDASILRKELFNEILDQNRVASSLSDKDNPFEGNSQ